jgi:hypothetical protein
MDENKVSGTWKGVYTQMLQDEKSLFEVDFEMNLTGDEDGFIGACKDLEIEVGVKEKSKIRGFIDDMMISLVKEYEHLILLDIENEEFILDKESKHPEIHYYGTYNESNQRFEGTWEIESAVGNLSREEQLTWVEYGDWWMEKVQN